MCCGKSEDKASYFAFSILHHVHWTRCLLSRRTWQNPGFVQCWQILTLQWCFVQVAVLSQVDYNVPDWCLTICECVWWPSAPKCRATCIYVYYLMHWVVLLIPVCIPSSFSIIPPPPASLYPLIPHTFPFPRLFPTSPLPTTLSDFSL